MSAVHDEEDPGPEGGTSDHDSVSTSAIKSLHRPRPKAVNGLDSSVIRTSLDTSGDETASENLDPNRKSIKARNKLQQEQDVVLLASPTGDRPSSIDDTVSTPDDAPSFPVIRSVLS